MASDTEKTHKGTSEELEATTPIARERPRSFSAIHSKLTSASSSSSLPLSLPLSVPRPVSTGSSGQPSKTLVQPRAWRFVHKSRMSSSLDRERAMEEDFSLEGDEERVPDVNKDIRSHAGSSVDSDDFFQKNSKDEDAKDDVFQNDNDGSSVDAVVRTNSDSDIAIQKLLNNANSKPVVFKSRAERFSRKDEKASQPKVTTPLSRSQTLPLSLPPQLSRVVQSQFDTQPQQDTVSKSSKLHCASPGLFTAPAEVPKRSCEPQFINTPKQQPLSRSDIPNSHVRIEQSGSDTQNLRESASLSSAKSDQSPNSPSRNITLNVQDSTARVLFSKPTSINRPLSGIQPVTSEEPVATRQSTTSNSAGRPEQADRPTILAKPSMASYSPDRGTPNSDTSFYSTPTHALTADVGPPKPPRTGLEHASRNSLNLGTPTSPMENVLFSMGFTIVDTDQNPPSKIKMNTTAPERSFQSKPKPDVVAVSDNYDENLLRKNTEDNIHDSHKGGDDLIEAGEQRLDEKSFESSYISQFTYSNDSGELQALPQTIITTEIVPKKMMKIKGDKKAEEKAAKEKKKERKAQEKGEKARQKEEKAREKEQKAKGKEVKGKQKKDESTRDKGRGILFPWRVEFSAKDKAASIQRPSPDDVAANSTEEGLKTDSQKTKHDTHDQLLFPERTPGVLDADEEVTVTQDDMFLSVTATSKKTEKGEGAGGSKGTGEKRHPTPTPTPTSSLPDQQEEEDQKPPQPQPEASEQRADQSPPPPSPPPSQPPDEDPASKESSSSVCRPPDYPLPPIPQPHPSPHHQQPHIPLQLQPPPKPKHLDDPSSSDAGSDLDSVSGSLQHRPVHISESDGESCPEDPVQGKRLGLRRHTVGGAQIKEQMSKRDDSDKKREAFYEVLAKRYPQYADKITGMAAPQAAASATAERNPRPRDPHRRRTTVVTYNPQSTRLLDNDDPGTMSDVEPSAFQRGGIARASLPIVRSASSSLERPIGLVFLVFGEETKKALLPNEITTLDTVRALFVRAYPEKLSMEFLDSPKRKIYILETATNIFFQLEDLRDIHDRTVLKIHECDSVEPQRVRSLPESRGRAIQQTTVPARPASRQGYTGDFRDEMVKTQSLPVSGGHNYQDMMHKERIQWEMEQEYLHAQERSSRSRSHTPELAERPRSLSTGAPRNRYSHSPERLATAERVPQALNPIPENPRVLANGFRQAALNGSHYEVIPGTHPHQPHPTGLPHPPVPGRVISPLPVGQPIYESVYQTGGYPHPQSYVSHSMRTAVPQGPQRATGPPPGMRSGVRGSQSNRHSLAFAAMSNPIYESIPQRSQSYRATPERDAIPSRPQNVAPHETNRMERMEAQIASLTAWVHQVHTSPSEPVRRGPGSTRSTSSGHSEGTDTYPGSSASSLSDIPAAYSLRHPTVTGDMREKIHDVQCRLHELRVELQGLKRMEQLHQDTMRDAFSDALFKIKSAIGTVPGADKHAVQLQHTQANSVFKSYMQDKAKVENELSSLESKVDAVKEDVISRKCRISVSSIEGLALVLSGITKSLADLKARFPHVHESLRNGLSAETAATSEEQFMKEEPQQIEATLKRCKSLTNTLFTLKRLAAVQDSRSPPVPPPTMEPKNADDEETMSILENIRAMVPDYDSRVQNSQETSESKADPQTRRESYPDAQKFTRTHQTAFQSADLQTTPAIKSGSVTSNSTGCRRPSGSMDSADSRRYDPPEVPAKPTRLLSASELKKMEETSVVSSASVSHSVSVTSQVSNSGDRKVGDNGPTDCTSARSAFFSTMQSHPASSTSLLDSTNTAGGLSTIPKSSSGATSASSSALSPTSPSCSKPVHGVYYQAVSPTRTRSTLSSIPLPNKPSPTDKENSAKISDKGKKVPPPPPPRKSSAKLPYGLGAGSSLSPNGNDDVGRGSGQRTSGDRSPNSLRKDSAVAACKADSPTSPGAKPTVSQKPPPMNKFQKDIAAGIYSNLNRPDLQHQKMAPDQLLNTMASPAPAAVVTNNQDPQEEGDFSGSESTGSTTSLDSQQGMALLRANSSSANRGPKPNPPQRHSSLSAKSTEDSDSKTKTQLLQERVRKSQEAGRKKANNSFSQVNGLGARNGHRT